MSVGPLLSHDTGFKSLLGSDDWENDDYYAVLATTDETPDRASQVDYEDILNECDDADYDQVALTGKSVSVSDTNVQFTCDKISWGSDVTISGRYLYILKGTAATPAAGDEIVGHIDLTGNGNASSTNAEFSFTPDSTDGLFEIERTAAPA